MNIFKAYKYYISRKSFFIFDILIPGGLILLGNIVGYFVKNGDAYNFMMGYLLLMFLYVECFNDLWGFNGICVKNFDGLEYAKTSIRGKTFIRSAVLGDLVVRTIRIFAVIFLAQMTYFMRDFSTDSMTKGFFIALLLSMSSVISVNMTRYFDNIQIFALLSGVAMVVGILIFILVMLLQLSVTISSIILAVIYVLIGVLTYIHMNAKIEQIYLMRE